MPDASGESVNVELDGTHLRVDARPARLVSLLRGSGGDAVLTAQRAGGEAHVEVVPEQARQVTFQVHDDLSVEATRASDFVALAEDGGRRVVVAFNGEVTVLPAGPDGDRFALGAHEALLVPGDGGDPRVVPVDDLSDEDQDEISAVMESAALGAAAPAGPAAAGAAEPAPAETASDKDAEKPIEAPAASPAASPAAKAAAPVAVAAKAGSAAKASNAQKRSGKKGKKGRPQPQAAKKQAPLVPGAAAAGAAGAAVAGAASAQKKAAGANAGANKAPAPAKKAASGRPPAGGGKGGGGHDDSYEDTPADRRFVAGAILLALVVVAVLAVFVLTGDEGGDGTLTSGTSTTTEADAVTTEAPTTSEATATTTVAPTTTTPRATTTAPTTTSAPTTTAAAAAPVKYGIEPKSCVQNPDNSITYTATVTNQSTVPFDYTVRVAFKDANGASVASSDANVSRVAPGRSVDFTATGKPNRNLANAGSCDVERVDARPSGS